MDALRQKALSRRGFLKLAWLGATSLVVKPGLIPILPEDDALPLPIGLGRVATSAIYTYSQPDFKSERTGMLRRDEIVSIYGEILSERGSTTNRRWYQLGDEYVHSAHLQRVDGAHLNSRPLKHIRKRGYLGEVTVPYSDSLRRLSGSQWQPLYRLYYGSVHWITGIDEGPDGSPWYRLTDDLLHVHFHIPASHMRPIKAAEMRPLSPHLPEDEKRIVISLDSQTLTGYEGTDVVLHTSVSTGIHTKGPSPNGIPTDTPPGRFRVQTKMPSRHMGDGELTNDIEAYELLGVPWVCFFHKDGLALHGTYWHDNFGHKMSHGCVNLRNRDALWLYRWTTPVATPRDWYRRDMGTVIDII